MLPDEVLLEIFDFFMDEDQPWDEDTLSWCQVMDGLIRGLFTKKDVELWQSLAHVCRQWCKVVFGSPRRLHLRLVCTAKTLARDTLDVWPSLPLVILDNS